MHRFAGVSISPRAAMKIYVPPCSSQTIEKSIEEKQPAKTSYHREIRLIASHRDGNADTVFSLSLSPFPRLYNETLYSSSPIRLPRISTYEVLHFNHRCSLLCPHLYLPLAIDNANFPSLSPFRSAKFLLPNSFFSPPPATPIAPDTGYAFPLFDNHSLRFRRA